MEYIIRENFDDKIKMNDESYLLNDYLKDNYSYIYESMESEGYSIRFDYFMVFSEIIFENKVVGFATYKLYESLSLTLFEIYILPEFRGNHLFLDEILHFAMYFNSVGIQEPTRKLVEILIHYKLAEKLNDNLVTSAFSFDISHKHLLKYGNPIIGGDICSCLLYDLNFCSPLFLGDVTSPGACDVAYQKCLKADIEDYGCSDFRKSIDIGDYFSDFKNVFLKNHKSFEEILMEVSQRLSSVKKEFNISFDDIYSFLNALVDDGVITPQQSLKIEGQIQKELKEGIIDDESLFVRINYLVKGEDLSKDTDLLLENLSQPQYLCPYCYQPIDLNNSFCHICGHLLSKNEYLMPDQIMDELQNSDAEIVDLRGDKLDNFIEKNLNDNHSINNHLYDFDESVLIEIYENNDKKAFRELKEKCALPVDNFEDIATLESFETLDFSELGITYFKNFYTSTLLIDLYKPIKKHTLAGNVDFTYGDVPNNYMFYFYQILSGLKENSNLLEVMESKGLDKHSEFVLGLFNDDYIESKEYGDGIYDVFFKFKVKELKDILRKHNLKVSGNKDDLIIRLLKHNLFNEFGIDEFILTPKGEATLDGSSWVRRYCSNLDYFDFDDFFNFIKKNISKTNKLDKLIFSYLNLHLDIAYKNRDFHRLHDVYASRVIIHIEMNEIKQALKEELTLFIIRLNPIFLNNEELKSYSPIVRSNIHNIVELGNYCNIYNFKKLFNKVWSDIKFEKNLIPKKKCFNYLNKAINDNEFEELSEEIKNKYYNIR